VIHDYNRLITRRERIQNEDAFKKCIALYYYMDLDKLEETLRNQDETHNYVELSISAYWFQRLRITDLDAPILTEDDIEEDFLYIPDPYKVRQLSVEIYIGPNHPQYFEGPMMVTLPPKLPVHTASFNKTKTPSTKINLDAIKANKSLGTDDFLNLFSEQKQTSSSTDVVLLPCIKTRKVATTKQRITRKVKAKPNYFKPESIRVELVKPIPKADSPKKGSSQSNLNTSNIYSLFLPTSATKRPSKGKTLTPVVNSTGSKPSLPHDIIEIIHASRVDDCTCNYMGLNSHCHQTNVVIDTITRTQDSSETITSTTETMKTSNQIGKLGGAPDARSDDTCSSGLNYCVSVNSSLYTSLHNRTHNLYTSPSSLPSSTSSTTETMTISDRIGKVGCSPDTRLDDIGSSGTNYSVPVNSSLYPSLHNHTHNSQNHCVSANSSLYPSLHNLTHNLYPSLSLLLNSNSNTTETMTISDPIGKVGCAPDTRVDDTDSSGTNYCVSVNSSLYTSSHNHTHNLHIPSSSFSGSTLSTSSAHYSDLHIRTSGLCPLGRTCSSWLYSVKGTCSFFFRPSYTHKRAPPAWKD
jgi:hypothetical protein